MMVNFLSVAFFSDSGSDKVDPENKSPEEELDFLRRFLDFLTFFFNFSFFCPGFSPPSRSLSLQQSGILIF